MKHQAINIVIGLLFLNGCVSVKLGANNPAPATNIEYKSPSKPFESISIQSADKAWRNKKTGSTLSYLSICKDSSDPSLTNIRDATLRGIEKLETVKEEETNYNERAALRTESTGTVDGIPVIIDLLIFKKNDCNYTLSLVGLSNKVAEDKPKFEEFLKGFVAP